MVIDFDFLSSFYFIFYVSLEVNSENRKFANREIERMTLRYQLLLFLPFFRFIFFFVLFFHLVSSSFLALAFWIMKSYKSQSRKNFHNSHENVTRSWSNVKKKEKEKDEPNGRHLNASCLSSTSAVIVAIAIFQIILCYFTFFCMQQQQRKIKIKAKEKRKR